MSTRKQFIAEWYEEDSIHKFNVFESDVIHSSTHDTLGEAQAASRKNSTLHGAMVYGSVVEQEYSLTYGWETTATYISEFFEDNWDDWERQSEL